MRFYGKTTYMPNPKMENSVIKYRTYKITGIAETAAILLGLYGGYRLIDYIFSSKKKENKNEME